ncbi:MAG: cupredoxin domain-containing protein [Gammaproteobacteria bacterium]|nr:cupredoxin domain-containing protein [Gammaproteobacteria bacterium]
MMSLLVNIGGVLLIGLIVYWFWIATPRMVTVNQAGPIEILVKDGVYSPALIQVKQGEIIRLRFIREDPSPCAAKVIFNSLGKTLELPANESAEIELQMDEVGEVDFTCDMQMYRGKLIVE